MIEDRWWETVKEIGSQRVASGAFPVRTEMRFRVIYLHLYIWMYMYAHIYMYWNAWGSHACSLMSSHSYSKYIYIYKSLRIEWWLSEQLDKSIFHYNIHHNFILLFPKKPYTYKEKKNIYKQNKILWTTK